MHMDVAHVCTMREGRTARLVEYMDRTEALEVAGLAGQTSTPSAAPTIGDRTIGGALRSVS
jgi:hypothetical protein